MPKRKPAPSTTDTYGSDGGGFIDDGDGDGRGRKIKKVKNGDGGKGKGKGKGKGDDRGKGKGEVFWEVCAVSIRLGFGLVWFRSFWPCVCLLRLKA